MQISPHQDASRFSSMPMHQRRWETVFLPPGNVTWFNLNFFPTAKATWSQSTAANVGLATTHVDKYTWRCAIEQSSNEHGKIQLKSQGEKITDQCLATVREAGQCPLPMFLSRENKTFGKTTENSSRGIACWKEALPELKQTLTLPLMCQAYYRFYSNI